MKNIITFILLLITTMHAGATPASKSFILYEDGFSSRLKAKYGQYFIFIDLYTHPSHDVIKSQGLLYEEDTYS